MRTVLRETFRSRSIALIALPWTKCSRRIRAIVSTTNIPVTPSVQNGEPWINHSQGSKLDADYPQKGGNIARRFTDQARRLKELGRENTRLRRAVADLTLEKLVLKEATEGNW